MDPRTLGDYRLLELLEERDGEKRWLAEQASVGRKVVLAELTDPARRGQFLADIRAKAAVDHPLIASVYEAVDDGACFAALEHLAGSSLAARLRAREAMRPADLAHILRRTAEAMLQLDSKGFATRPLEPADIHYDTQGVIRLANLARAGAPDPAVRRADVVRLGETLPPLVADSMPGASRLLTVLSWMRGEGLDEPIGWQSVRSYGTQIEDQLRETQTSPVAPRTQTARPRSRRSAILLAGIGTVVLAAIGTFLLKDRSPATATGEPALPPPVFIAAGQHPTPDGGQETLPEFEISACEVTIGEYLKFLQVLERLDPDERDVFDLEGQPEDKTGHEPDDWNAMLAAAKSGGTWRGRPINLFCPVVNLDWWDASAYCNWRGCRLPTQEEWFAALRSGNPHPETLQPAGWGPVIDITAGDLTANGLRGMAGSVAEWTRRPALNPANPLGAKRHVIIGGSYEQPANGALSREWTDNRLLRRPDLGFRVVSRPD